MRPVSAQDFVWPEDTDPPPVARRPQTSIGFRQNDYEDYSHEGDHTPLFEMLAPPGSLMIPSRLRPHSAAAVLQETNGSSVASSQPEDKRRSRLLYIAPAPDFGLGSSFDYFSGVTDVTRVLNDRIKALNETLEPSAPRRGRTEKGGQEEEEDPVILAAFRRKQAQTAFDATYLASLQALQIARGGGASAALEAARLEAARKKLEKKEDVEKQASKPQASLAMKQAASSVAKFSLKGAAQKVANLTAEKHSLQGIAKNAISALNNFTNDKGKNKSKTRAFVNEKLMEKVAVYRGDSHKRQELRERCEWHAAMARKQHPESAIKRNIKKAIAWGHDDWHVQHKQKDRRERLHDMAKDRRMAMEAEKQERERRKALREMAAVKAAPSFATSQPLRPSSCRPLRPRSPPRPSSRGRGALRPRSSSPGGAGKGGGAGQERVEAWPPPAEASQPPEDKLKQALAALAMSKKG